MHKEGKLAQKKVQRAFPPGPYSQDDDDDKKLSGIVFIDHKRAKTTVRSRKSVLILCSKAAHRCLDIALAKEGQLDAMKFDCLLRAALLRCTRFNLNCFPELATGRNQK